jgi:hypothetical protein
MDGLLCELKLPWYLDKLATVATVGILTETFSAAADWSQQLGIAAGVIAASDIGRREAGQVGRRGWKSNICAGWQIARIWRRSGARLRMSKSITL